MHRALFLLPLPLLLAGCGVAKAVITAPIKAGEIVYDTATESQEEADIKRGRALRKQEEAAAREANPAPIGTAAAVNAAP